jgi:hypothetical protein
MVTDARGSELFTLGQNEDTMTPSPGAHEILLMLNTHRALQDALAGLLGGMPCPTPGQHKQGLIALAQSLGASTFGNDAQFALDAYYKAKAPY